MFSNMQKFCVTPLAHPPVPPKRFKRSRTRESLDVQAELLDEENEPTTSSKPDLPPRRLVYPPRNSRDAAKKPPVPQAPKPKIKSAARTSRPVPFPDSGSTDYDSADARKHRQYQKVLEEFVTSEKSYLDHLNIIIKYFMDPFETSGMLGHSEIKVLFGEIKSIRLVNQVLYDHLCSCDVISGFASQLPYLKLYSSYARNFPSSQHKFEALMKKKGFADFVRRQECRPEVRGLKLPALLIMPIQRIPRYKLLLEDLHRNALSELEKYQIEEVMHQLKEVADLVNDCVTDYDNTVKIIEIQNKLDSCAPKLLQPGRKFIREGEMKKVTQNGTKHWKLQDRMFWLFSDILMYGKPNPRKRNRFLCSCIFPLRHCYTERIMGKNMFRISCKGESLLLMTESFTSMEDWISALESAIMELRESRVTLRKESSNRTPQRRKLLNAARRRTSSLSEKFRTKQRVLNESSNSSVLSSGKDSHCERWIENVVDYVKRKRKRSDTPTITGKRYVEKQGTMKAKRQKLSVTPRLSTLDEEDDTDVSYLPESSLSGDEMGDVTLTCDPFSLTPSKSPKPWWAQHDESQQENSSPSPLEFLKRCSIM